MKFNKVRGTKDYFGLESKKLVYIIKVFSDLSFNFKFDCIKFPTMEYIDVFKRALGSDTDIVNKEMYSFKDKKGRVVVLRPEGTAPVARLVLENKLTELGQKQKLFYIENMFRYERPQKGRQREFIQFGAEVLNAFGYQNDVEVILLAYELIKKLQISKFELKINYIGTIDTRNKYNKDLREYFKKNIDKLSDDSKKRLETNVLRILDSKDEQDIEVALQTPLIIDYLNTEELENYANIKKSLDFLDIEYSEDKNLVRGLDYYNGIVFEFISTDEEKLGSKSTLIGGGRYDKLITQFDDSKDVPAVGFAAGVERLMLASEDFLEQQITKEFDYAVVTTDIQYINNALKIASQLREKNYSVEIYSNDSNTNKKTSRAIKDGAKNLVIVCKELNNDVPEVEVKNLKTETSKMIKIENIGEKNE